MFNVLCTILSADLSFFRLVLCSLFRAKKSVRIGLNCNIVVGADFVCMCMSISFPVFVFLNGSCCFTFYSLWWEIVNLALLSLRGL